MLMPLEISQQEVKSLLRYDPESGLFTRFDGSPAGAPRDRRGYIRISACGKRFYAQRLAFIYMTGTCPPYVDHIDEDRANNRWANLRAATKSQNGMNRGANKNNTSGFKGVSFYKNAWVVELRANGKKNYLGRFQTLEEAAAVAKRGYLSHHGEFARP